MADKNPEPVEAASSQTLRDDQIVTERKLPRRSFLTAAGTLLAGGAAVLALGRRAAAQDSDPDAKKNTDPDSKKWKKEGKKKGKETDPDAKKNSDPDSKKWKKEGKKKGKEADPDAAKPEQ